MFLSRLWICRMRGSPKMQNFSSTYLVEWEVLSKLQVACLCCFIFQPQIGFLLSIFATFLVLISDLLQRPSKTTQRFAIAACYCILSPKRILLSPFARSPPSPTSTVSSWVSKAKMREKLTTLQYWRYQLYTQKKLSWVCVEPDKNAVLLVKCLMLDICSMNNHYLEINTSNKQEEVF